MEKATIYDYARMCSKYAILDCQHCPLSQNNNRLGCSCDDFMRAFTDKANEIILKWCEEHPVKTRQDEFLKMFPNARIIDGIIGICPRHFEIAYACKATKGTCHDCRKSYWLAEVEE